MSPKNRILTVGLTALGLFGYAATRAAYSGDPAPPSGPSAAPAPTATPSVLLLTNGRLLEGPVQREQDEFVLSRNGGEIRFHKNQVEDVFGSVRAVYQYKLAQIPANDPDEHMKLARWCLGQNLTAEARSELQTVLKVSPKSNDAKLMLGSIASSEARAAARPRVDPGLVQTRAELPDDPGRVDARPAEIDVNVLRKAQKELRGVGLPVIFDLPPALAVKRADHFYQFVHPVLQASCVKCHNEKYDGPFQLIEVKKRRDLTADVIRANLDATLKLIDPENPARSELLSRSLVPHGTGSNRKPIFRGSNDPRFQIVSAWVNSLRTSKPQADSLRQARFDGAPESNGLKNGAGFATERGNAPLVSEAGPGMPKPYVDYKPPTPRVLPSARFVPGQGMVTEQGPASSDEFPVPYMAGGPRPGVKNTSPGRTGAGKPGAGAADPATVPLPGDKMPDLPPVPVAAGTRPGEGDVPKPEAAGTAKPKKAVKIPDGVLERMLLNRNNSR